MKNPFAPNGITSQKIIYNLAKEEFGGQVKESNSYLSIKRDIISIIKKMKPDELEEKRLEVLIGIEHSK